MKTNGLSLHLKLKATVVLIEMYVHACVCARVRMCVCVCVRACVCVCWGRGAMEKCNKLSSLLYPFREVCRKVEVMKILPRIPCNQAVANHTPEATLVTPH